MPLAAALAIVALLNRTYGWEGFWYPLTNQPYVYAAVVAWIVIAAGRMPVPAYAISAATLAMTTAATVTRGGGGEWLSVSVVAYLVAIVAIARKYDWFLAGTLLIAAAVLVLGSHDLIPATALATVVVVLGLAIHRTRRVRGELVEVRHHAAEQRGQRQLLEERARIAREMHDVVAHHMSVIAVQASTAEFRHNGVSDPLREEFRSIADSARESLTEMRRLLGVFRQNGQVRERSPQPGVEGIGDLAESAERTGIDVSVSVPDDLPELPDTVSLTAYRIVQEALSNVVRHAAGASAKVELYLEDEWLVVLVMNDSSVDGLDATTSETPGFGLAGMRERVTLVGGDVLAERLGRSGFVVKARLPLEFAEKV